LREPAPDPALNPAMSSHPATPSQVYVVEVDDLGSGKRLDSYLAAALTEMGCPVSRTRLKGLLADGNVESDGRILLDGADRVKRGQKFRILIPDATPPAPTGEIIPLDIVYEDDHLIVVDKPAGLTVHPGAGHQTGTLVNALIAYCGNSLSGIGGVQRPGIVHRLDKDTSGLLVVAKNDLTHRRLSELFSDHGRSGSLLRQYLAIAWGVPDRPAGTIITQLGRHPHQREKMAVVASGRTAITHWQCLETYSGRVSLMRCRLETGRTHQIRVHLAHIGHPLLGDVLYGSGFKTKSSLLGDRSRQEYPRLSRQALHATLLGFQHPISGASLRFESPLPPDLRRLAEALGQDATP
jgi:23S rRNA pseudouridine1911/1915/1917 synthase